MIGYSASTVFHQHNKIGHYATFGAESCWSSIENFLNFCELQARNEEMFGYSDVHIQCIKVDIHTDGTVNILGQENLSFLNHSNKSKYNV